MSRLAPAPPPARRFDLDWLRVLVILMLVPYHTARIFDIWDPFYVKSAQTSALLSWALIAPFGEWAMQLLFLLCGAAAWFALGRRTPGAFLRERSLRLLIPFAFGILVLAPPLAWFARLQQTGLPQPLVPFLASYWTTVTDFTGYDGNWTFGHFWFLLFLFVYAAAALPLFVWLRRPAGGRLLARTERLARIPGAPLLLLVPLALSELLPGAGDMNPWEFLLYYVAGYALMAAPAWQAALDRQWRALLAAGVAATAIFLPWAAAGAPPARTLPWFAYWWLGYAMTLLMVLGVLGLGRRTLGFGNAFLAYAGEASFPFYILHQTVLVALGYWVLAWELGPLPAWAIIVALTCAATFALYEFLVRRFSVTRLLFGLRARTVRPPLGNPRAGAA